MFQDYGKDAFHYYYREDDDEKTEDELVTPDIVIDQIGDHPEF